MAMGESEEVCLPENAIQAFLEYLVEPLLPAKSSIRKTFVESQLELVAKQVHAAVLMYNYYHRKQHPQLALEGFNSFYELAVVLKPGLLAHFKLDVPESQLSPSENAVMAACSIAESLDASKDAPSTEEWPISKVSVFLVDSNKERCMLQHGIITKGVWSAFENEINEDFKKTMDEKHINKKIKVTGRLPTIDELGAVKVDFQQLAFSTVRDATGIKQSDLTIIESHVTYSLSKEKSATSFYIMQSIQPTSDDDDRQIPIKDTIESLQGPLVKKTAYGWITSPAVEYFHLLPYADFLLDWLSRGLVSRSLQEQRMDLGSPAVHDNKDTLTSGDKIKNLVNNINLNYSGPAKQEENNGCPMSLDEPRNMDVDDSDYNTREVVCALSARRHSLPLIQEQPIQCQFKIEKTDSKRAETNCGGNVVNGTQNCGNMLSVQNKKAAVDHALVPFTSKFGDLDNLLSVMASKKNVLSQTALRVLSNKKDKLIFQLRDIEDEIAQCDKKIHTISTGGEDGLSLIIDSVIEGCNEVCLRNTSEPRASQNLEYQSSSQYPLGKTLSDAIFNTRNPCQELDGLCGENNWMLPVYRVSSSDGRFEAKVTLQGMDFDFTSKGKLTPSSQEARESAALEMLLKLRTFASSKAH